MAERSVRKTPVADFRVGVNPERLKAKSYADDLVIHMGGRNSRVQGCNLNERLTLASTVYGEILAGKHSREYAERLADRGSNSGAGGK